jgi:hypothetical protein
MTRTLYFVSLVSAVLASVGCSSSSTSNAGGTCSAAAPCGGTLDGTWTVTSVCAEGNLAATMNQQLGLPAACDNTFQSVTLGASGTVTFANGMETDNLTQTMDANLVFTAACESAVANQTVTLTSSTCTTIQQSLTSASSSFTTANCSLSNGSCVCTASYDQQSSTTPASYTVSGSIVTYTGTDPDPSIDYCVSGTTLTARQALSGVTGVTVVSVLQKQ